MTFVSSREILSHTQIDVDVLIKKKIILSLSEVLVRIKRTFLDILPIYSIGSGWPVSHVCLRRARRKGGQKTVGEITQTTGGW